MTSGKVNSLTATGEKISTVPPVQRGASRSDQSSTSDQNEKNLRGLTLMEPRVLDTVLEIQPVTEEFGNLARQDQGSSLSLLVEKAFPFIYRVRSVTPSD